MYDAEHGQGLVEYVLVLLLTAVVVIALLVIGPVGWVILGAIAIFIVVGQHHKTILEFVEGMGKSTVEKPVSQSSVQPIITIHLDSELEPVPMGGTEEVWVPAGVQQEITLSRQIEYSVQINWKVSGGGSIDMGYRPLVESSIYGEFERGSGHQHKQSEIVTQKVKLDGENTGVRYEVIWVEMWRKGTVELQQGSTTQMVPFQYLQNVGLRTNRL